MFEPVTSFRTAPFHWQSRSALAAGLVLTGLLVAYLWSGARSTEELARSNSALLAEVATRKEAEATGCWLNVADIDDFMVAQPWLKGIEQAHAVSNPNSLRIAALSVG